MKNRTYKWLFFSFALLGFFSCEDFEDPNIDFSNSLPQYVEFSSGDDLEGIEGGTISATVRMRAAQDQDITISYGVTGDLSLTGTVIIEQGDLSNSFDIDIPNNTTLGTGGTALLNITAVDNGLDIGRGGPDAGFSEVERTITWEEDAKVIGLDVDTVEVSESGLDTLRFIVSASNPVDENVSVGYTISGDLVGGGTDYTLLSANPLVIASGASEDTVEIIIATGFDNATLDGTRSFYLELDNVTGGNAETSLAANQALGRDFIDDTREVSITGTSQDISGSGVVAIPVTVSDLGFDHSTSTAVTYTVTGGTAGVDYNDLTNGNLGFVLDSEEEILIEVLDAGTDVTLMVTVTATDDPEGSIGSNDTFTININNAP